MASTNFTLQALSAITLVCLFIYLRIYLLNLYSTHTHTWHTIISYVVPSTPGPSQTALFLSIVTQRFPLIILKSSTISF